MLNVMFLLDGQDQQAQQDYSKIRISLCIYIRGKCWLVIIHPWPTMYMYFYTTQHNYYNLDIRSNLRLNCIKSYYIL
jgi:hypothetical protein